MKKVVLNFAWIWAMALLIGCAGVSPQTPAQQLAVVDTQFQAIVKTAVELRQQGLITDELYVQIDPLVQQGSAALDVAWTSLGVGDLTKVDNQIRLVNKILWELRDKLPKEVPK